MVADEDCTMQVRIVPIRTQRRMDDSFALLNELRNARTSVCSLMSGMEFCRNSSPRKRRPKPRNISETSLFFIPLLNMSGSAIAIANRANSVMSILKPTIATIHPVMVVPMFAPMITPIACIRLIRPAFTKLTTMTVVADDDCIMIVIRRPVNTAIRRLLVMSCRNVLSLFPADFCRPSERICIPYRNSPSEPTILTKDNTRFMVSTYRDGVKK